MHLSRIKLTPTDVIANLAGLVNGIGAMTQTIGGTIGFHVHGMEGGCWILDLSIAGGDWQSAEDPEDIDRCSTRVYAYASIFPAILINPAAIAALLESGEIVVEGDKSKLKKLSQMLSAGGSMLDHRVDGQRRSQEGKRR